MEGFKSYLLSRQIIAEKKVGFYLHWVARLYSFCNQQLGSEFLSADIDRFLKHLSKEKEQWQVKQASEAIQLYIFYQNRKNSRKGIEGHEIKGQWKSVAEEMVKMLRLRHRSYRTEQSYMSWLRSFHNFVNGISPHNMQGSHVKDFLTHLAVEKKIFASTQNQAFNAILFFYRHVLDKEIGSIGGAVRASKKRRLPVVLTKSEVDRLLDQLN